MKIEKLLENIMEKALKSGASQAEVFLKTSERLSAEVKKGLPEAIEFSSNMGYSLRILVDGRLGFSYSTSLEEWERALSTALESARWAEPDRCLNLPERSLYEEPKVFDPEIERIIYSPSKKDIALTKAQIIEKSATEDKRIKNLRNCQASFSLSETIIFNSKGITERYKATGCSAQVMAVAEACGDSQMGWDFESSRFLSDISFERVGSTASRRALRLLEPKKITPQKAQVAFENSVAAEFLSIFSALLSADAVQKGKSLLKDKVGKKVISDILNIVDDGLLPSAVGSKPFDDEGVPTTKKILIREGVVESLMHNTYTACKGGERSTGNAIRGGYSSIPLVGPTNLYLECSKTSEDILSALDRGLFVTDAMGVHTANPISGDFSIGVSGLWVEGGIIKHPIKEAVITGNILELFSNVEMADKDFRFYGNIGSPGILIKTLDISG